MAVAPVLRLYVTLPRWRAITVAWFGVAGARLQAVASAAGTGCSGADFQGRRGPDGRVIGAHRGRRTPQDAGGSAATVGSHNAGPQANGRTWEASDHSQGSSWIVFCSVRVITYS